MSYREKRIYASRGGGFSRAVVPKLGATAGEPWAHIEKLYFLVQFQLTVSLTRNIKV